VSRTSEDGAGLECVSERECGGVGSVEGDPGHSGDEGADPAGPHETGGSLRASADRPDKDEERGGADQEGEGSEDSEAGDGVQEAHGVVAALVRQ
jgi:hypothetical protein